MPFRAGDEIALLNRDALRVSEDFKTNVIYSEIKKQWSASQGLLLLAWLQSCAESFTVHPQIAEEWERLLIEHDISFAQMDEIRTIREVHRIERRVVLFLERFRESDPQLQHTQFVSSSGQQDGEGSSHKFDSNLLKNLKTSSSYLPNHFVTDFIVRFELIPNDDVFIAIRALASLVIMGQLSPQLSTHQIFDWIDTNGGINALIVNTPILKNLD